MDTRTEDEAGKPNRKREQEARAGPGQLSDYILDQHKLIRIIRY